MERAVIYIRTSTTENQDPKLQLAQCEDYCKRKNWEVVRVFEEQQSAFKDESKRLVFNDMIEHAKKHEFEHIVVWNMDRFSRQPPEKVMDLVKLLSSFYNCQVHAANGDAWSEIVETINGIKNMGFLGTAISEFLEKVIRGIEHQRAYNESKVKSERVKSAVRKKDGVTYSYKGNKWGRDGMTKQSITKIIELHKSGLSQRKICLQVFIYDKYGNKRKNVSLGVVNKIIQTFVRKGQVFVDEIECSQIPDQNLLQKIPSSVHVPQ